MKRIISEALRSLTGRKVRTSISDNEAYPELCLRASRDERAFESFRSHPVYNEILEHVTQEQGSRYLEIVAAEVDLVAAIDRFKANDKFGRPQTFEYPSIGRVSPSTLRYIKVLADLRRLFTSLDGLDICEIGVGYGGQCRIVNAWFKPASYCLIDIGPALSLARRYLGNYTLSAAITYRTMDDLVPRDYDLVISNYAFTELTRAIQDTYLARVILRSARGYITYNEISPAEFSSYKADELLRLIPDSQRFEETPLTHPRNCLIVWGHGATRL